MNSIRTHNGIVTIKNPATGGHRTFRIRTQPDDARFMPGRRLVSLLIGENNETDYQSFGVVDHDDALAGDSGDRCGIWIWRKHRDNGSPFPVYAEMLWNLDKWKEKAGIEVLFASRCRKCNRTLTDPMSIELGIGPKCRGER